MTEATNTTARINASYSLKVPSADVPFASQDQSMSISMDVEIDPTQSTVEILDTIRAVQAALATEVKLSVFAQLGVQPTEIADGVIAPDLSNYKAAEKPKAAGGSKFGGGGGGYGGNRGNSGNSGGRAPAAGRQGRPSGGGSSKVFLSGNIGWNDAFGVGEFYDNREKKRSGDWKPNAADFAPVNKDAGLPSLWMQKNGAPNENVLDALEAAGIEYQYDEFA